jgi:signal transduction histidine kinase
MLSSARRDGRISPHSDDELPGAEAGNASGEVPMSLRLKMILGIGLILLMVSVAYALLALRLQTKYLQHLARHEADLIAETAERGLTRGMERGESQPIQAILVRIGEHSVLRRIRIVGLQGEVLRSSNPQEIGQILAPGDWSADGTAPKPVWNFRERIVSVFRPIVKASQCAKCHTDNRPILGFLNVVSSFPPVDSGAGRHWMFMVLTTVFALAAAGAMIAVLFTFVIGRRLDTLSQTMSRVEAGDLTARVPENGTDELEGLAKSFNTMVVRLADARRQIEDRHLGEIRRAEHMAALGKMAAGIAHEINNPLAGMQNCVRTLLKRTRDEAQRVEYLAMLREGLDRIGRTVGRLLDFARETEPQLELTDLSSLLRRCLTLLEHELAARGISVVVTAEHRIPTFLADPRQLEQVFLNLLMNAMDAMPDGGKITVSINQRDGVAPPFVEIQITDTGVGIAPEHLPRIFDPFFTTKDVGKGTGLGLSVSYGIVRGHGGSIEVKSEVGKGSTLVITLPIRGEGESDVPSDPAGGRRADPPGDARE